MWRIRYRLWFTRHYFVNIILQYHSGFFWEFPKSALYNFCPLSKLTETLKRLSRLQFRKLNNKISHIFDIYVNLKDTKKGISHFDIILVIYQLSEIIDDFTVVTSCRDIFFTRKAIILSVNLYVKTLLNPYTCLILGSCVFLSLIKLKNQI